jgi:serine-type D-Ala-D-Ala carboxypeptidase (penicillin-binding protein 5/6)
MFQFLAKTIDLKRYFNFYPAAAALVAAVMLFALPASAQSFQTQAPFAILVDVGNRTTLYEKGANEAVAPASLAKVMTAAIVFEEIRQDRLKLEDEFIVSENAWRRGGATAGGSAMFAVLGTRIKVTDLLHGLIVQSGNDAALVLAEGIAGNEATFVERMNARARDLGLTRTVFANATGFGDPAQKSTLRDLAVLAQHVIETYPELYKIFGTREFTWNKVRQQNRNPLLTMDIGADGLKTGMLNESGFSLLGSAVQNGKRLIVAVSGVPNARDRALETRKLLEWGFRAFESREIFTAGERIGEAKVYGGERAAVTLMTRDAVTLLLPKGSADKVVLKIVYTGPLVAPVPAGKEVARLQVIRGTIKATEIPLVAAETVGQGTLQQRGLDALLEITAGNLRKLLSRS